MLDCFCGLGGVSDGFALEGFDVLGVDIEDMPTKGYKHNFQRADIRDLKGEDYGGYDVIWGSPPCRDFSQMAHVGYGSNRTDTKEKWAWKIPPDPMEGLKNVNAFLGFVKEASPILWIMENVPGLCNYLDLSPRQISKIEPTKKRAFWGNFPAFLMPMSDGLSISKNRKGRIYCIGGKDRSWKRAKIPLSCSSAFARACKEVLTVEAVSF